MNWVRQRKTSGYQALIMTPQQQAFEILLNTPEPRRTLVLCDAATALRVSEILGLMWMDLNFDDLVMQVRRAYAGDVLRSRSQKPRRHLFPCIRCWPAFCWRGGKRVPTPQRVTSSWVEELSENRVTALKCGGQGRS